MANIQIASGTAQHFTWALYFVGDHVGSTIMVKKAVLSVGPEGGAQHPVIVAVLPSPIALPKDLLRQLASAEEWRFASAAELALAAGSVALVALRDDVLRRLRALEVDWSGGGSGSVLLGASATARGELRGQIRINVISALSSADVLKLGLALHAEFSLWTEIEFEANNSLGNEVKLRRGLGFAVRLETDGTVNLACSLAELGLELPECPIELPRLATLSLTDFNLFQLASPKDARATGLGALDYFRKYTAFIQQLEVTYGWTDSTGAALAQPALALRWKDSRLLFAVVGPNFVESDFDLPNKTALGQTLAKFGATLAAPGGGNANLVFELKGAQIGRGANATVFAASLTAGGNATFPIGAGKSDLGPLRITWQKTNLTVAVDSLPLATGVTEGPANPTARAVIECPRLVLALRDDPSTALALAVTCEITPAGVRVTMLKLLEPYPFELLNDALAAIGRGGQQVLQFLGRLQPQSGDLEKLREILRICGRLAAAVAGAVVFAGEALGELVRDAGELLAKSLAAVADLVAGLFRELARLLENIPAGTSPNLDVEVRIGLNPLELRQVVVTLDAGMSGRTLKAAGIEVSLPGTWRPMLLLDLVTEPGAYLMAVRRPGATGGGSLLAKLSTDLWLKAGTDVRSVRDADGTTGERPAERILTVEVHDNRPADNHPELAIVVAGLQRGKPIFFGKATNPVGTRTIQLPSGGGTQSTDLTVVEGPFAIERFEGTDVRFKVDFKADRVLPFFGMGESGGTAAAGDGFLDRLQGGLGQVVSVEKPENDEFVELEDGVIKASLILRIQAAGLTTRAKLSLSLNLETFELGFDSETPTAEINSRRIEETALGLTWIVEQVDEEKRKANAEVPMFRANFVNGESAMELTDKARMQVRFDGLSAEGGVTLNVSEFRIGRSGLDLVAKVDPRPVKINGLDVPFTFTSGGFTMRSGKLIEASVAGKGQLPRDLVGEANCSILLNFGQDDGGLVLQSGKVEIEKKGEPIVCHSTRFTLTLTDLDLDFVREGGYHFFFLVTGSLRFTPKPGEFADGLLKHLGDVEIALERAPLTGDPRVLARHVSFQKALSPKIDVTLFNAFRLEVRSLGFHGASPKFADRPPALNIGGQVSLGLGDVMQPKIDFHGLWIAPPAPNESLPRIKADGLGVELNLAGAAKVRGTLLAVDPDTRTVEGRELAPPGYNTYGFLGEGAIDLPGWGSMQATLGFLEVERQDRPGERQPSFFLYLQANQIAVPVWLFHMREVGFGFGFRYTLAGIKEAENARSTAELVRILDDVSLRQNELARFSAWKPDPGKDNFTLAMKAALQLAPANKVYVEKEEKVAENIFFFDVVAALRSDLTFLMTARGWLGLNYFHYAENAKDLRSRPGFRGFLYISVPRSEFLLRGIGDSTGFIGQDHSLFKEDKEGGKLMREALQSVDWTTTLYLRPGLLHYEIGWPDQLVVRLVKNNPDMRVTVRGGMIFRAAEDGVLLGYNIGAEAFLRFGGSAGGSSLGVAIEGRLDAQFTARLIAYLAWRFSDSLVYGLLSLDARLTFSVRAWLKVDLRFTSFTIKIRFSFTLQFSAAVELVITPGGAGARVTARVGVQAFGCTLSVAVGFSFNEARLDEARARVARFLAMSITAEQPDAPAVFATPAGDRQLANDADQRQQIETAPAPSVVNPPTPENPRPDNLRASEGMTKGRCRDLKPTDFWVVLREAVALPAVRPAGFQPKKGVRYGYAFLVPKEPTDVDRGGFYAAPTTSGPHQQREECPETHVFANLPVGDLWVFDPTPAQRQFVPTSVKMNTRTRWHAPIPVEDAPPGTFTLAHLFDECYFTDTSSKTKDDEIGERWSWNWKEPGSRKEDLRVHGAAIDPAESLRERELQRDRHQRAEQTRRAVEPEIDHVLQARSTALAMFLDQFSAFSEDGALPADGSAHVTDLGILFFGSLDQLEALANATIGKLEIQATASSELALFNPYRDWFDAVDPVLADERQTVETDGVKLGWRLELPAGRETRRAGSDFFLHHYEITRTIEGDEFQPKTVRVKPVATIGAKRENGYQVELLAPDWQFIDRLVGDLAVPDKTRRALLPSASETDALAAAINWLEAFPGRDEVTLTYTVTPVDIGGARALPKSFTVDIQRPRPPCRPAIGEVRLVQKPANATPHTGANHPNDLELFVGLQDRAWSDAESTEGKKLPPWADRLKKVGDREYAVGRIYRLILDPEEIAPAGYYGTDGASQRIRGPGPFAPPPTADERFVEIYRQDTFEVKPGDSIAETLVDAALQERLPRWIHLEGPSLSGKSVAPLQLAHRDELLSMLWVGSAKSGRVATRFSLQTIVRIQEWKQGKGVSDPSDIVSRRVAVPCEHLLIAGASRATLRPEAFEWVVPLAFPALGRNQVAARAGFARYVVPAASATVENFLHPARYPGLAPQAEYLTDVERRTMTQVSFAAVPDWAGAKAGPDNPAPHPLHRSAIAGFEVHELALDELAHGDTARVPLDEDVLAWRRARLVARIEQLTDADARLVPESNRELLAWTAHYPSETRRVHAAGVGGPKRDAKPRRSAWYGAHESTAEFAVRLPRMRFFPEAPEPAVAALLSRGRPTRVRLTFKTEPNSNAAQLAKAAIWPFADPVLHSVSIGEVSLAFAKIERGTDGFEIELKAKGAMQPADLRGILLSLGWDWRKAAPPGEALIAWRKDPGAFDGLRLTIGGWAGGRTTGEITLPLNFRSPVHPLLEEVIGELAYKADRSAAGTLTIYREVSVMVQPRPAPEVSDFPKFLAQTAPAGDPYGWAVLQMLGLAVSVRLHDGARDEFLDGDVVTRRVNDVFQRVLERWAPAAEGGASAVLGAQAFIEVHLKPGYDRAIIPPDGITGRGNPEKPRLDLADDALAFVQIALRPQPRPVWNYQRVTLNWSAEAAKNAMLNAGWPADAKGVPRLRSVALRVTALSSTSGGRAQPYWLAHETSGNAVKVTPVAKGLLPLPGVPVVTFDDNPRPVQSGAPRHWTIVVRRPVELSKSELKALLTLECVLECERDTNAGGTEVRFVDFGWQGETPDGKEPPLIDAPAATSGQPDPFDRFQDLAPNEWAAALGGEWGSDMPPELPPAMALASRALTALFDNVRAALPRTKLPAPADIPPIAPSYLEWIQRFLDHCAPQASDDPADASLKAGWPSLAFAAPVSATPWKLAADANGCMSVSFLHSDRWGSVRAYAVKPISRYDHVLGGLGLAQPREGAGLVEKTATQLPLAIGYGVSVTPRTEKLAAPVILGARRRPLPNTSPSKPEDDIVEVIIAQHGEEGLAHSNRSLYARLGCPTGLKTFSRAYRLPKWPAHLAATFAAFPVPNCQPTVDPDAVTRPATPDPRRITGAILSEVAATYPTLWKGAEICHLPAQPPHFRLLVTAAERAGNVVSDPVGVVFDDMPRRPLKDGVDSWPDDATISFVRAPENGPVLLVLTHTLLSHADLTPQALAGWNGKGGAFDIGWWPDPDVTYILQRFHRDDATGVTMVEDDAEIRLISEPLPGATVGEAVVVRSRGALWETGGAGNLPSIALETKKVGAGTRTFRLTTRFRLRDRTEPEVIQLVSWEDESGTVQEWGNDATVQKFNERAALFAHVTHGLRRCTLEFHWRVGDEVSGADYLVQLRARMAAARVRLAGLPRWVKLDHDLQLPLNALEEWINDQGEKMVQAGDIGMRIFREAEKQLKLPIHGAAWLPAAGAARPLVDPFEVTDDVDPPQDDYSLILFDVAADEEIDEVGAIGGMPLVAKTGRLRQRLARRFAGPASGWRLRAIDGRARLVVTENPPSRESPGVIERDVERPSWLP